MTTRRFSLAVEQNDGNEEGNKPITAFLVDTNYANYDNSSPCINKGIPKMQQLKKSRSAPAINEEVERKCRLQSEQNKVFAVVPKRRFSICDLNTFDDELLAIHHHPNYSGRLVREPNTCPATSIVDEKYPNTSPFFPKKHCRRNSVAIKFQNPRSIDNSIDDDYTIKTS